MSKMSESAWDATAEEEPGSNSASMESKPATKDLEAARLGEESALEKDVLFNTTTESSQNSLDRDVSSSVAARDLESFANFDPLDGTLPEMLTETLSEAFTETSLEYEGKEITFMGDVPCYNSSFMMHLLTIVSSSSPRGATSTSVRLTRTTLPIDST